MSKSVLVKTSEYQEKSVKDNFRDVGSERQDKKKSFLVKDF